MKNKTQIIVVFVIIGALVLGGCESISLAADVTPPPDYVAPTTAPTLGVEAVAPSQQINLRQGEVVYLEKCAPCHGEKGLGNGPQASDLPVPVPALVSPSMVDAAAPQDWYRVTVAGRMDRSMPPFTSLTPGQIWDVIGYIYTLDMNPDIVSAGKLVFDTECKACHGALGKGDGAEAAGLTKSPPDLSDPAALMDLSQRELIEIIAGGKGTLMPAFSTRLDQGSICAAAVFVRGLGFAETPEEQAAPVLAPVPTGSENAPAIQNKDGEPTQAPGTPAENTDSKSASIRAVLTVPAGGYIPKGLTASLVGYDAMQPVFTIDKKVGADYSAQWDGIEVSENRVYLIAIEHDGVTYRSRVIHGVDMKPGEVVSVPVEFFETTADNSSLTAERVHVFFDFPSEDRVQVVQMFLIANPGPAMVIPSSAGEAVVTFDLPPGYTNLQFESGELGGRYLQTANGFGDTTGVQPGSASHQILFAYEMAYQKSAVIPLHMPLKVTSAILLTPGSGVRLEAQGLQDAGARTLQEGDMRLYTVNDLAAGSILQVKVSGLPGQNPAVLNGTSTGLFIGGGALIAVLVGIAVWLIRRREPAEEGREEELKEEDSVESLLDAIIALDDLYQAGKIPTDAYKERRAELKERLRAARER